MKPEVTSTGSVKPPLAVRRTGKASTPQPKGESEDHFKDSYLPLFHAATKERFAQQKAEVRENAPSEPKPAPKTQEPSAPLVLQEEWLIEEQETTPKEKPLTLAQMAKQATRSIGRGIARAIFGDPLKQFKAELNEINSLETEAKKLKTPEQFAAKTAEFKKRLEAGETLDDLRTEAYAVAREAARQATREGMRAYDCQVLGALSMDNGTVADMKTGEGKTLTAVLPLYLNALAGKGAHLITVNSALAKRDSEWMGPIFKRLGMTVGCVTEGMERGEKKSNYDCDITYVTDRELGFDFLRDRLATDPSERVQRGHFFALVDEADEVLLDEARTPMIISSPRGEASEDFNTFDKIVKQLEPGEDFEVNEQKRTAYLTEGGLRFVENELTRQEAEAALKSAAPGSEQAKKAQHTIQKTDQLRKAIRRENAAKFKYDELNEDRPNKILGALGFKGDFDTEAAGKAETQWKAAEAVRRQLSSGVESYNLYHLDNIHRTRFLEASLKANTLFRNGKDYTVENGEVKIVDQGKGRVSDGKRFSLGLHQALEAKEGLPLRAETHTVAKITMPELFNSYERRAGMSGTALPAAEEFFKIYKLGVTPIPTHKPLARIDRPDTVFATKAESIGRTVEEAIASADKGRPVLVGTASVNSNKAVAAAIYQAGWPKERLQILNAERVKGGQDFHDKRAGRSRTITLTTGERWKKVQPEEVNYFQMAQKTLDKVAEGKPVLVEADNPRQVKVLEAWLRGSAPLSMAKEQPDPSVEGVQFRVRPQGAEPQPTPDGFSAMSMDDFKVDKPKLLQLGEDNMEETVQQALEAFEKGEPVVVDVASHLLGETAGTLMDHGLGFEAVPMVCGGKEKENAMIELAGRSGVITVATNMAGRGANIKPDMVATEHISEKALQDATEGKPVTITVDKKSQALKITRLLKEYIPVSLAESPDQKAEAGKVLVRFGKDLDPPAEGVHHKGEDFRTDGLLVIGTERAASRRIDDQLIGRAGRQGAVGESRFFTSLEDDVPRVFGGEMFQGALDLLGEPGEGVSNPMINSLMEKAQDRVEAQQYEQRENANTYGEVDKIQRKTFYGLREQIVTGEEDSAEFVADFGAQGVASMVLEELPKKSKYSAEELKVALKKVNNKLKLSLNYEGDSKVKGEDIGAVLYPQIESLMKNPKLVPELVKKNTLSVMDMCWRDHLETMDSLRDGIHLVAFAGKDPELAFKEQGFEQFSGMLDQVKSRFAEFILPAAAKAETA